MLVALLAASIVVMPMTAQEEMAEPTGLPPDAPTFAVHGPYAVGTMEMMS